MENLGKLPPVWGRLYLRQVVDHYERLLQPLMSHAFGRGICGDPPIAENRTLKLSVNILLFCCVLSYLPS